MPTRPRERQQAGALSAARSALTLAAVPRSLPCREAERAAITEFVEEQLNEGELASKEKEGGRWGVGGLMEWGEAEVPAPALHLPLDLPVFSKPPGAHRGRQVPVRERYPGHRQDGHGPGGHALAQAQEVRGGPLGLALRPSLLLGASRHVPLCFPCLGLHAHIKAGPCNGRLTTSPIPPSFLPLCVRSEAGDLPQFQFVEINGLRLPSPQHAYSALYEVCVRVEQRAAFTVFSWL